LWRSHPAKIVGEFTAKPAQSGQTEVTAA
jgi:hypothetical protein